MRGISNFIVLVTALLGAGCREKATVSGAAGSVEATASSAAVSSRSLSTSQPGAPLPSLWHEGELYEYTLHLTSRLELPGDGKVVDFSLDSPLELRFQAEAGGTELFLTLTDAVARGRGESAGADFSELERELALPFALQLKDGRVDRLQHSIGLSSFAVSVQRTLAAALQFSERKGAPSSNWSSEEFDATGKYVAEYFSAGASGLTAYDRKKVRYLATVGQSSPSTAPAMLPRTSGLAASPLPEVISGTTRFAFSEGSLSSVSHTEELQLTALGGAPITSKTTLSLERQSHRAADAPWPELAGSAASLSAPDAYVARVPDGAAEALLDKERIGQWTFATALEELKRVESASALLRGKRLNDAEKATQEQLSRSAAKAFTGLTALLRTGPKNVEKAVAEVTRPSEVAPVILDALGSSQSSAAERALASLLTEQRLPGELRRKVAGSLIRVNTPTDETLAALTRALDDPELSVHATYGLGTLSRKLRVRGTNAHEQHVTDAAARLTALLVDQLNGANSTEKKINTLRGIANSGDSTALAAVRPHIEAEDASVRLAAIQALRLMDHPDVDAVIAQRSEAEKKANVRKVILQTLLVRAPSPLLAQAAERLALHAEDTYSRVEAVNLLARWRPVYPDIRAVLQRVVEADSEQQVRDAARRALAE